MNSYGHKLCQFQTITDEQLHEWWPDLAVVVIGLRRLDYRAEVDGLLANIGACTCSSEVLAAVGDFLQKRRGFYHQLNHLEQRAWDTVAKDVYRAFPGARLRNWLLQLWPR